MISSNTSYVNNKLSMQPSHHNHHQHHGNYLNPVDQQKNEQSARHISFNQSGTAAPAFTTRDSGCILCKYPCCSTTPSFCTSPDQPTICYLLSAGVNSGRTIQSAKTQAKYTSAKQSTLSLLGMAKQQAVLRHRGVNIAKM